MTSRYLAVFALLFSLAGCGPQEPAQTADPAAATEPDAPAAVDLATRAAALARESIIIDTHIDVPYRVHEAWEDVSVATEGGDFDYPRAVKGGLNAPFMSIYTPAGLEAEGRSKAVADELIDLVNRIASESPDKFAVATSPIESPCRPRTNSQRWCARSTR